MNEMELQTTLDPIEMDMGDPEIVYSPVLPNPEGEPTDDLTKVQIQGNIYQIKDPEVHDWARAENKPTYTKAEVGLGNVDNTSDMDKPVSTATQTALDNKVDKVAGKGLSTNDFTNDFKTKLEGIEAGAEVNTVNSVAGKTGNVTLDKSDVGLGNVDNTSDMNKPVSTATQTALNGKADKNNTYTKSEVNSALDNKADKSNTYTKTETDTLLNGKVDKDGDKVLSDNNYSDTDKTKLDGIEANANHTEVDTEISATSTNPLQNKAIYDLLNDLLPEGEATGNPITISNASGFNAKDLTVDMLPIQAGSGTPSPDNVRPISGRTSLDVTVNGDTETLNFSQTVYGGTCDVVNGGTRDEWIIFNVTSSNQVARIDGYRYNIYTSLLPSLDISDSGTHIYSDKFETSANSLVRPRCYINSNGAIRFDTADTYATKEDMFSAIGNIQFVVKLATPTTITTPTTPISLNKGNNTLSTSGDNMDLKYSKIPQ